MTVKANRDQHGRTYLTLRCDGCNTVFTCYDDACYRPGELRIAATFAGWEVRRSSLQFGAPRAYPGARVFKTAVRIPFHLLLHDPPTARCRTFVAGFFISNEMPWPSDQLAGLGTA
jgi:hypothetical protein